MTLPLSTSLHLLATHSLTSPSRLTLQTVTNVSLKRTYHTMPAHKRGPWSQTEDHYLLQLVQTQGAHNWVRISSLIQTRSPKQCRERYHQNLKPNLNHDPITPEEGVLIEQMVAEMGKRWAEIARRLRGRSDNAVKNWWNGGMNRRRRNQQRRAEITVRETAQMAPQQQQQQQQQQALPQAHGLPDQSMYFANSAAMARPAWPQEQHQAMYYQPAQIPSSLMIPQVGHPRMQGRQFETPLPSPSAFSHMSEQPSLVSDGSSYSNRSPHSNASPVDLPPLGGQNPYIRRHSSMNQMRVPGYRGEEENQVPMQFSRSEDGMRGGYQRPHHLQEAYAPELYYQGQLLKAPQAYAMPMQYPQAIAHVPSQMYAAPQHHHLQSQVAYIPSTQAAVSAAPSLAIANKVAAQTPERETRPAIDPALSAGSNRDGTESPKEKMRLSSMIN